MKFGLAAVTLSFVSLAASNCAAELVGFYFSGSITSLSPQSPDPFGAGFKLATPVNGHIVYDPDSLASDPIPDCVCMGYRQDIRRGFTAMIGSTFFEADSYVVQIQNQLHTVKDPDTGENRKVNDIDTLSVRFSNDFDPKLPNPLLVNNVPYPNSFFDAVLTAAGDTFVDASLPRSLDLSLFNSEINLLNENGSHGSIDVIWKNLSLNNYTAGGGDYDKNGYVNNDDYIMWRNTFGSTSTFDADGDEDGVVDAADYVVWRQNLGQSVSSGSVPEPSCEILTVLTAAALTLLRSSRIREC